MTVVEAGRAQEARPASLAVCILASLLSGALMFGGIGLAPVWWLAWLAPIPVLALAPRVGARRAAWTAAVAELIGMAGYARYLGWVLHNPVAAVTGACLGAALVLTATVLLFRALVLRRRVVLAVLAPAASWAASEYLVATLTPSGSGWVLADGQADNLPVLRVVSVTGPWGVGFVIVAVACAVAALTIPGLRRRSRIAAAMTGVVVLGLSVLPWVVTSATSGSGPAMPAASGPPTTPVSVVAAARPTGHVAPRADSASGRELLTGDLDWLARSAPPGGLVVFPEKDLVVDDASLPGLVSAFRSAARDRASTVVAGVEERRGSTVYNTALVFGPDGGEPLVYHKRFPVPGVEAEITPGDGQAVVPGSGAPIGVAICADLGQPSLGREYGRAGVGLLAAPALDFDDDAWFSSRLQSLRGVENGYAVARAARRGLLTVTDPGGRVLAEAPVDDARTTALTVDVPLTPGGTLYSRWGEGFAWLCLAVVALGLVAATRRGAGGS